MIFTLLLQKGCDVNFNLFHKKNALIILINLLWRFYEKIINQEFTEDSTFNGDYNEYKAQKTIAQNNLGNLYYNGHGVKQDKNKAKELYEKACNGGNFISCESLKDLK